MAPGVGALPAAEAEVPGRGAVRAPRADARAAGARAPDPPGAAGVRVAAVPVAVQPLEPRGAPRIPRRMERSRLSLHRDLLLFLKVLAGTRLRQRPARPRARSDTRRAAGWPPASGAPEPASGGARLGDLEPPAGGEDCDVVDRRLGRGRRGRRDHPRRGRTRRDRARGRALPDRAHAIRTSRSRRCRRCTATAA